MPQAKLFRLFLTLVVLCGSLTSGNGQNCTPPPITANSKIYNIFSPEQEMIVGELVNERVSSETRFYRDQSLVAYLEAIGQRLVAHLPPTGLKYRFQIIDLPGPNAFNTPGGNVYISRKLISFCDTEDELAGIVAHELGHATVRHSISDYSEALKAILNVTQVGDRKDITEKYNLLFEKWRTKFVWRSRTREENQQFEADRIGVFALIAAGYDPNGLLSFFERKTEKKGKSGNWFTDVFGNKGFDELRLRRIIDITARLGCPETREGRASEDFVKWQASVVSYRERNKTELLPGLMWKRELKPRLRSDISHFAFSQDGKYFLAQDDFAITVIRREPLEVLFQIPLSEAEAANFTPDSQFVVFGTTGLRFEKWSIAEQKAVTVRELIVRHGCLEHSFSSDGKYVACVDQALNLNLLETETGKRIWQEREFYRPHYLEYDAMYGARQKDGELSTGRFFHMVFSPDSHFLLVSRSNDFRYVVSTDAKTPLAFRVVPRFDDPVIAVDLKTLKRVSIGGDVKRMTRLPFVFLDSQRLLGMSLGKTEDSGVISFPDGKRLMRFPMGAKEMHVVPDSSYAIVKPMDNAKLGVIDVNTGKIVVATNSTDAAIWKNIMVSESVSGAVLVTEIKPGEKQDLEPNVIARIEVPVGAINRLSTSELSDNFQWLAASSRTRGGLWNLVTGERKQFLRGFKGVIVGNDGGAIADFPKADGLAPSLALMNAQSESTREIRTLPEKGTRQYGLVLLTRRPLKPSPAHASEQKPGTDDPEGDISLTKEVRFELRNVLNDQVLWSREFPGAAPRYSMDQLSGRLILFWKLGSEVGKQRLKEDPALAARAKKRGSLDDDYLVELVGAAERKTIGTLIVDTGNFSFNIESGLSQGGWLVLFDQENRVLVFSMEDGELQHRFFGKHAAINQAMSLLAIENYPGELRLYDLSSGEPVAHLSFKTSVAFIRFSVDGQKLFVLTGEQTAYAFDVARLQQKTRT